MAIWLIIFEYISVMKKSKTKTKATEIIPFVINGPSYATDPHKVRQEYFLFSIKGHEDGRVV